MMTIVNIPKKWGPTATNYVKIRTKEVFKPKIKLIREKMKTSQGRQKSYYDKQRKPFEFQEGDNVFLKVTLVTRVGWALKLRKLSSKFIGPCQILKRIGCVAYQIALLPSLSKLHSVFHVSQLRKYIHDPLHMIEPDIVQI